MLNKDVCKKCIYSEDDQYRDSWDKEDERYWNKAGIVFCPAHLRAGPDHRQPITKLPRNCPHMFEHCVSEGIDKIRGGSLKYTR